MIKYRNYKIPSLDLCTYTVRFKIKWHNNSIQRISYSLVLFLSHGTNRTYTYFIYIFYYIIYIYIFTTDLIIYVILE